MGEGEDGGAFGVKHQTALFLERDTLGHLDWLAEKMTRQAGRQVSRSEAVELLVRRHWKETHKRRAAKARKKNDLPSVRLVG